MTTVEMGLGVPKFSLVVPTEEREQNEEESDEVETVELRELENLLVDMNVTTNLEDEGQSDEGLEQSSEVLIYAGNQEHTNFTYKALGVLACPECEDTHCRRPVRECCGHVKCRGCYISNADYCRQCQVQSSQGLRSLPEINENLSDAHKLTTEKQKLYYNSDANAALTAISTDEIMIEPSENEYILELEQSSGGKSIALVSSATLKALGLDGDDINEDKSDEEEEDVNGNSKEDEDSNNNNKRRSEDDEYTKAVTLRKRRRQRKRREEKSTSHIVKSATDSTKHHCEKCSEDFEQEDPLFKFHIFCDQNNGTRPYICKICGSELSTRSRLNYHMKKVHSGKKPLKCNLCKAKFFLKLKLNRHMKVHENDVCKIDNNESMEDVQNDQDTTSTTGYECAYCTKTFSHFSTCRKHLKTHLSDRPYGCKICGKTFLEKYTLQTHLQIHSSKRPHPCSRCEMAFTTAKDLRRHFLCHTGELPFVCGFCKQAFRRKDNMERHIRTTHGASEKVTKMLGREAALKYNQSINSEEVAHNKEISKEAAKLRGRKAKKHGVLKVTKIVTKIKT